MVISFLAVILKIHLKVLSKPYSGANLNKKKSKKFINILSVILLNSCFS